MDADLKAQAVDLHELAKGWKAAIARATDPASRHETRIKNDRGNLPLHTAASFRAPIEVTEALLEAYPEAASITNNYGNLALHFTAWKKGPLDVERLLLKVFPEGAAQKNNHGNLPLHYASHYNAPLEVVEALYNAYPEGAHQKNNDSNTPLDLAIADGASPNVVALLQGKTVPPSDDEVFDSAKARCERMEKELQRAMEGHGDVQEDLEAVLSVLMEVKQGHPHALYSSGMNPTHVTDMESLLEQVRRAGEEERRGVEADESSLNRADSIRDEEEELQLIEESLLPPDDEVEWMLSKIIGLDSLKNQIRGIRRTIEMDKFAANSASRRILPRHLALVGNPGTGKTFIAGLVMKIMHKIGAVPSSNVVAASRDDLIDRKSESRTIMKTRRVLERASGGVLFVDEAYLLLPSVARPRGRDYGPAALRELARGLSSGSPLVILAGYSADLQRILAADIGFKGNFLTRVEIPDPSTNEIARMFFSKMIQKGLVASEGLTINFVAQLLESNTEEDWRSERNGYIADLMLNAVRSELKSKMVGGDTFSKESVSPRKLLAQPGQKLPVNTAEEVLVTAEELQSAVMNGL
jgi:SpoVK/Ycf46/Vps4 family AAA+-type ATPase